MKAIRTVVAVLLVSGLVAVTFSGSAQAHGNSRHLTALFAGFGMSGYPWPIIDEATFLLVAFEFSDGSVGGFLRLKTTGLIELDTKETVVCFESDEDTREVWITTFREPPHLSIWYFKDVPRPGKDLVAAQSQFGAQMMDEQFCQKRPNLAEYLNPFFGGTPPTPLVRGNFRLVTFG